MHTIRVTSRGRARRKISDIVKAGLAGLHDRLIRKDTKTDRKLSHPYSDRSPKGSNPRWPSFWAWNEMLSDQALKQGRSGDALAHTGDEGRSTLR